MTFSDKKTNQLESLLNGAHNILITAHKGPDADSVGSSLGLFHFLKKLGKDVVICHPDKAPSFLHWMPGHDQILNYEDSKEDIDQYFENADLIFCLDYNAKGRIGRMESPLLSSSAKKVMIDHHRDPETDFCELTFSDPENSSTSQMIVELIEAREDLNLLDQTIGEPLYAGIMMDTGSFRFPSTTSETHRIVAKLIDSGTQHWKVHEYIHDTNTIDRLKLVSYALLEKLVVLDEFKTAYVSLDKDDLKRFKADKGDTEGLVNQALSLTGIRMAAFFKESDGLIKISFRSKGDIPVNNLASNYFEGGGHKNAAGGKHLGKIDAAIAKFEGVLPEFKSANDKAFG